MFSFTADRQGTGLLDRRVVNANEISPDWSVPVELTSWARKGHFKNVTGVAVR